MPNQPEDKIVLGKPAESVPLNANGKPSEASYTTVPPKKNVAIEKKKPKALAFLQKHPWVPIAGIGVGMLGALAFSAWHFTEDRKYHPMALAPAPAPPSQNQIADRSAREDFAIANAPERIASIITGLNGSRLSQVIANGLRDRAGSPIGGTLDPIIISPELTLGVGVSPVKLNSNWPNVERQLASQNVLANTAAREAQCFIVDTYPIRQRADKLPARTGTYKAVLCYPNLDGPPQVFSAVSGTSNLAAGQSLATQREVASNVRRVLTNQRNAP